MKVRTKALAVMALTIAVGMTGLGAGLQASAADFGSQDENPTASAAYSHPLSQEERGSGADQTMDSSPNEKAAENGQGVSGQTDKEPSQPEKEADAADKTEKDHSEIQESKVRSRRSAPEDAGLSTDPAEGRGQDAYSVSNQGNQGNVINNGIYYIASAADGRQVLDIAGGNRSNGANVQLYRRNGTKAQQFLLTYHPEGYYSIHSVLSGRLLEVQYGSRGRGANVDVYEGNETDAQRWVLKKTGDGFFHLYNVGSDLYLNLAGGNTANGTNAEVNQKSAGMAQKFRLLPATEEDSDLKLEEGSYYIAASTDHEKVMDIPAGKAISGANVQVYSKNKTKAQQYRFVSRGKGYYSIHALLTDRVLDVASASRKEGANVQLYDYNGSDAQLWRAQSLGGGTYCFVSRLSGKYLTMAGAPLANGTNVQVNRKGAVGTREFYLSKSGDEGKGGIPPQQVLSNGTYLIASARNGSMVLDIPSGDGRNGANVQIYDRNDTAAQRYTFMYRGDGTYTIYNASTGRVLDVSGANRDNGANVQIYDSNDSPAQRWKIAITEDGHYRIISALSDKVLDLAENKTANETNVQLWEYGGGMNQKFSLIKAGNVAGIGDGVFELHSALNDRKAADLAGASMDNGGNLQIYDGNGSRAQRFIFSKNSDGSYRITSAQSGKLVTYDGGGQSGANVFLRESDDSINQRFYLADAGGGRIWLLPAHNRSAVLDLTAGNTRNGSNLQVYAWNGSKAQIFQLERTDARSLADGNNYRIHAYNNPGQVIDIRAASKENGVGAGLYEENNTDAQRFQIVYDERGYYTIRNVNSDKDLEVEAASHANGARIQQYAGNDTLAQKWIIHEAEKGSYSFINMASSKAMDIPDGRAYSGAKVQQWFWGGNNAQKFTLSDLVWDESVNRNSIAYDEFNRLSHQERFARTGKHLGIDVSKHNGTIDWQEVKKAGVEFAIIRAGNRGVKDGSLHSDPYAIRNLQEAKAAGLKVGVYFYSQALNAREGEEEARHAVALVRQSGIRPDLPVFMDYEYYTTTSGRLALAHISKDRATEAAQAFYRYVTQEGYQSGIYASKSFFYEQLHPDQLSGVIWLAHYSPNLRTDYKGNFNLWQYSSTGHVPGIQKGKGNVDMNVLYE